MWFIFTSLQFVVKLLMLNVKWDCQRGVEKHNLWGCYCITLVCTGWWWDLQQWLKAAPQKEDIFFTLTFYFLFHSCFLSSMITAANLSMSSREREVLCTCVCVCWIRLQYVIVMRVITEMQLKPCWRFCVCSVRNWINLGRRPWLSLKLPGAERGRVSERERETVARC